MSDSSTRHSVGFPVAYKLALVIGLLIVSGMVALGLLLISNQSELLEARMQQFGFSLAQQLGESAKEPILANDRLALDLIANNIVSQENIGGAALFADDGRNLTASGQVPAESMPLTGRQRNTFLWGAGRKWQVFVEPVILREVTVGYAMLTLDRAFMEQAMQQTVRAIVVVTLPMLLLGILVALLVGRRITRPINTLIRGSDAIHAGNYDFRFAEKRNDELGLLMNVLNGLGEGLLRTEQLERTFSKYVSPEVSRRILNDLEEAQIGGRRVEASVLFADIVGFTHLAEEMAPDQVHILLNDYFSHIDRAARLCGGYIDKFMGDCAMLAFGVAEEDSRHPQKAAECALLIHRVVDALNAQREQRGEVTARFSIGINSGVMLAGNTGSDRRMEYTVVGDTVNLASRLGHIAGAGETVLSAEMRVHFALDEEFEFVPSGSFQVRGKREEVEIDRLTDCRPAGRAILEERLRLVLESADE